jgi:hypothetical protein
LHLSRWSYIRSRFVDCIFETIDGSLAECEKWNEGSSCRNVLAKKMPTNDVIAMRTFDRLLKTLPRHGSGGSL